MGMRRELPTGRRVLVVGGGIAGLGVNLPGNAVAALRSLGVEDDVAAYGAPGRRREYRNARGRLYFTVDETAFWGRDVPVGIRRGDLVRLLRQDVAAAQLRGDAEVRTVRQVGDEVEVSFSGAGSERYDLVIGADGVHSTSGRPSSARTSFTPPGCRPPAGGS